MTDVDNIEAQPMDLNDDEKGSDTEKNGDNGDNNINDVEVKKEEVEDEPVTAVDPAVADADVHHGKVVQVTNVSPGATIQQLATLFGFLGTVTDIRLYPSDEAVPVQVKVCYVSYENNEQCGVAQHLTNTVFIDKALIVVPINREEIPEENECQHLIKSINAYATLSSTGYLPNGFPPEEPGCTIPGIPPPPVITSSADPVEIEEIKRTIFVQNIDDKVTSEQLMAFFSGVGEVKYMRICKKEPTKYAFIEFTGPESVPTSLQYNGVIFGGKCLKVEHAKSPIVKPESERIASGRNPLRTGRDVVKRPTSANLRRSRSRSRSRRSRSRGRTSITRSKPRSRSGSRTRRRKSRSKSPRRRSSPVRTKRRSRSRTRSPVRRRRRSVSRSRSRSRSWSKRRRSRSRSRSRDRRRRKRSTSRSPSRSPRRTTKKKSKSRSRSPRRRKSKRSVSKSPERRKSKGKDKDKDEKKEKSKDKSKDEKKDKGKDKEKTKEKSEKEIKKESSPDKDLKSLLDKVYNYEEEKEREKKEKEDKEA